VRKARATTPGRRDPEALLFGAVSEEVRAAARMSFSDLTCEVPEAIGEEPARFVLDARSPRPCRDTVVVPAGTSFAGKVYFDAAPTGFERSRALTAILDIKRIGAKRRSGSGYCSALITDRTAPIIFVSYAWEDAAHIEWTRRLAERLGGCGVDVLLDQLHPHFDPTAPQEMVDEWMVRAIATSDKVLAILTPTFRRKADDDIGGVSFELRTLQAEGGLVSEKLRRYVAAIAKGDRSDSCPRILDSCPIFDLRSWPDCDTDFEALASELRS
jgi:hypothetical protein